jgi:phage/plasmid primase-like uncharacterized protein
MYKNNSNANRLNVQGLRSVIKGRERELLQHVAGIPKDFLDSKNHPCPKCGGTDRFRWMIEYDGKPVYCNQCFKDKSDGNKGDVIAAVMWLRGVTFLKALQLIAEYLQTNPGGKS